MNQLAEIPVSTPPTHLATLVDILRWRSQGQSTQTAYTFLKDGQSEILQLTYSALDQKARSIASRLQTHQVSGQPVLLIYPPGLEFISAFFGCLYAGAIAVPAYPPRRNQKLPSFQRIIQDARITVALTTQEGLTLIQEQWPELENSAHLQWITTEQKLNNSEEWQSPVIEPEMLAFLQYTSGSTGTPKGVMVSHKNLLYNLSQIQTGFGHTCHSRGVIWLPPYHDMGLVGGILQPIFAGFPVVLMPPAAFLQKPIRWLQAISTYQATTSGGPNFAYDLCVDRISPEQKKNLDLSQWQIAFNGSESVRARTLQRFSEAFAECGFQPKAFYPCYGMAETTLIAAGGMTNRPLRLIQVQTSALSQNQIVLLEQPQKTDSTMLVGCGQALLDQEIIIVDPNSQQQCPPQQVGEIWIAGKSVAKGYWNQSALTHQTFQAHLAGTNQGPYLRTGDLGFLQDGELFVTGRLKDMVIIRGRNYYPQDIELTVQSSHPSLQPNGAAAFAVTVDNAEKLVITQEIKRSALKELNIDEIVEVMLSSVLEHYKLDVYSIVLLKPGSIPKTTSGKIQRSLCRTNFLENTWVAVGQWFAPLQTKQHDSLEVTTSESASTLTTLTSAITEEAIVDFLVVNMANYLNILPEQISPHKTFARNGLNSITAVNLTADLQNWLSIELEPVSFWEYTTIKSLSRYLYKLVEEQQNQISKNVENES